jgi:hypothetical protein
MLLSDGKAGSLHLRAGSNPWRIPSIAPAGAWVDLDAPSPPRGTYRRAQLALDSGAITAHSFQSKSLGGEAAGPSRRSLPRGRIAMPALPRTGR